MWCWRIFRFENCKCRKKLVEECTENIGEVKISGMALFEKWEMIYTHRNEYKSSGTNYVVLIVIVFTISIGISTYFIYYK